MAATDTAALFGPEALAQLRREAMTFTDPPADQTTETPPLDPNAGGTPASEQPTGDTPDAPEKLSTDDRLNLLAQRLGFPDLDYTEAAPE